MWYTILMVFQNQLGISNKKIKNEKTVQDIINCFDGLPPNNYCFVGDGSR